MEKYLPAFLNLFSDPAKRANELAVLSSLYGRLGNLVQLIRHNKREEAQSYVNKFERELFCGVAFERARFQALIDTIPEG